MLHLRGARFGRAGHLCSRDAGTENGHVLVDGPAFGTRDVLSLWRHVSMMSLAFTSCMNSVSSAPLDNDVFVWGLLFLDVVLALACKDTTPGGHAGVGVVSLRGAPLTPFFRYPGFSGVFASGRAMRVVLPLVRGSIHFLVRRGEGDPGKLALTNKLSDGTLITFTLGGSSG